MNNSTRKTNMIKLTENTCDVLIIGAGPGGSTLAYFLAQRGIKVILLDKEKFPRKKVCAGGLPHNVLEYLPFNISSAIEEEIFTVTLTHKLYREFTKIYHKPLIYIVNRERFDNLLVQKSVNLGVDFLESQKIAAINLDNNSWTVKTADRVIKANLLVGADGANSFVAKQLNLCSYDFRHIGLQVEISRQLINNKGYPNKTISLDWGTLQASYGWIFPKGDIVSIGVMGPAKSAKQLKMYLCDLLKKYNVPMKQQNLSGHIIPHRINKRPIYAKKAILIGDAAGLVDFWTGEGISYSIKSAQIASKQIGRFLDGQITSLNEYEKNIDKDLAPNIKTSYQFSQIFNYLSPLAFNIIRKYDYPWDVFCKIMRGDRTFLEMKRRFRADIIFKKLIFKR